MLKMDYHCGHCNKLLLTLYGQSALHESLVKCECGQHNTLGRPQLYYAAKAVIPQTKGD